MLRQRELDLLRVNLQEAQLLLKRSTIKLVKETFKGNSEPNLRLLVVKMEAIRYEYDTALEQNRKDRLRFSMGLQKNFLAELKELATWERAYVASSYKAWQEVAVYFEVETTTANAAPAINCNMTAKVSESQLRAHMIPTLPDHHNDQYDYTYGQEILAVSELVHELFETLIQGLA